jgi:hypothetical protein
MEDPSEVERKRKHNESEIRRRSRVNNCFEDLRQLLLGRIDPAASRAQIIAATVDAVKDADARVARLQRHVDYILKSQQADKVPTPSVILQAPIYMKQQQPPKPMLPWVATSCILCEGKVCEFSDEISNALLGKLPKPPKLSGDGYDGLKVETSTSVVKKTEETTPAPLSGSKRKNSISGKPTDKRQAKRRNSTGDIASSVQLLPIPTVSSGDSGTSSSSSGGVANNNTSLKTLPSGADFADILTKSTIPMCFLKTTGEFLFWNDSFAAVLWGDADCYKYSKRSQTTGINRKFFELLDATSLPVVITTFEKILKSQDGQIFEESGFVPEVKFNFTLGSRHINVAAAVSFSLSRKDQISNDPEDGDKVLCIVHHVSSTSS